MIQREYKKFGIRILELHYEKNKISFDKKKYDIIKYYQSSCSDRNYLKKFYTIFIDLRLDQETIFNQMSKNTKYEIKRNLERDEIQYEIKENICLEDIQNFLKDYALFEKNKRLKSRVSEFKNSFIDLKKNIVFSKAIYKNEVIVWHVYYVDNERARLKCSVSLRNENDSEKMKLIGRSNRGLHYKDIIYFKNKGKLIYDLGGIDKISLLKEKININKFKQNFGGREVVEYEGNVGLTLKGKFILFLLKVYRKVK